MPTMDEEQAKRIIQVGPDNALDITIAHAGQTIAVNALKIAASLASMVQSRSVPRANKDYQMGYEAGAYAVYREIVALVEGTQIKQARP